MKRVNIQPPSTLKAYLGLAIFLVIFITCLVVATYVFIWVALIGAVFFVMALIRQKLFGHNHQQPTEDADFQHMDKPHIGQVYDQDDENATTKK